MKIFKTLEKISIPEKEIQSFIARQLNPLQSGIKYQVELFLECMWKIPWTFQSK